MSRTLLVEKWSFHTARVRNNRQDFPPYKLHDIDLYDFICEHAPYLSLRDEQRSRMMTVDHVNTSGRSLLVTAKAGAYNEPGTLVDTTTGDSAFEIGPEHAPTAPTRTLIIVPDQGLYAIAFYERSTGRGMSGPDVRNCLQRKWREYTPLITWEAEWLIEAEAWLQTANLKAVSIRRYRGRGGTNGPVAEELGEYVFAARASRGKFFRHELLTDVLADPRRAHSLFGQQVQPDDEDRVFVELSRDGRQKTYALERGSLPKAQLQIPDAMSDEEFITECVSQASGETMSDVITWNPKWV